MPERRQSPRQCSTCPTSQGLPGAGGKGGPEVKDLSPAGLGLWQALFRSAASVSGKATRLEGRGHGEVQQPSRRLLRVCSMELSERAAPLGRLQSPRHAPAPRRSGVLGAPPERG